MCNSTGPHGRKQCSARNIFTARPEPYGARYTRYSARCHSLISLMVWTTTSASHSFSHLIFGSVVFCPSGSWGCIPFFLWAWVAFCGCSFWCLFFFRGCSFSFLWRGRWCLFFLWWGSCVVFLCCCCCWGWCLFFLCSCCWCFCWCCSFGRSLVFLWGGWWLGWWVSLGLLLLWGWWLGRGHPHGLWVGAEVLNLIGLVRLPPRLPLVQLLIRFAFGGEHLSWQLGMNSDQSSSSSSSSPCWLGLH